jgi:hypothetical protein
MMSIDEAPAVGNALERALTIPTVDEAITVPLWPTAARTIGIRSRGTAYRCAAEGTLPFSTLVVGGQGRRVVPTAELRRVLGLDAAPDVAQGA